MQILMISSGDFTDTLLFGFVPIHRMRAHYMCFSTQFGVVGVIPLARNTVPIHRKSKHTSNVTLKCILVLSQNKVWMVIGISILIYPIMICGFLLLLFLD